MRHTLSPQSTVVVAMSGGVDSSVSAVLLKQQGMRVIGVLMKNWADSEDDSDSRCSIETDAADVRRVCKKWDIPFYTVNFEKEYAQRVFRPFLRGLQVGETPNPDIICNREIKFSVLWEWAKALGADRLATGHYARLRFDRRGIAHLLKGSDAEKDQSYFLSALAQDQLKHVCFPVGEMTKAEVRGLAQTFDLSIAQKPDSQGICFVGERPMRGFLSQYLPKNPGPIVTTAGEVIGRHDGLHYLTIGQRHGLHIGGGTPYFVVQKHPKKNEVVVAPATDDRPLYASALHANKAHWILGTPPSLKPFRCAAKIRYRQPDQTADVKLRGNDVIVSFASPQRAITPGQTIVFHHGEEVLGSATIRESLALSINP